MTLYALPRSAPEAQGISSSAILKFVEAVDSTINEFHSFMLVRHGQVVAEGWWDPYKAEYPHMLFSLSKSYCSTAVGLAVEEGCFSLDDLVVSFFPEELPETVDPNLVKMQVKHLLMMGTGHHEDTSQRTFSAPDGNWVKAFLSLPVEHEPGTYFVYNTAATYMLSAIVQKVSGKTLVEFLTPRLFEPLGIEGATWESCPRGINTGGFGLNVKTEDIAKFGQLYLQKGVWQGKRILTEAWVEAASSKQISNGDNPESDWNQGYGYQFWRCRHNNYRGDGAFGQYCIIMPDQDAVLAITSGLGDMQQPLNLVWEHLLPAMQAAALPDHAEAQSALVKKLQSLAIQPPAGNVSREAAQQVCCKTFELQDNGLKASAVRFDFCDERAMTLTVDGVDHKILLGAGEWLQTSTKLFSDDHQFDSPLYTSGVWTADDTFTATLRYYTTPFYMTWTVKFTGDEVEMVGKQNVNFGPTELPVLKGKMKS